MLHFFPNTKNLTVTGILSESWDEVDSFVTAMRQTLGTLEDLAVVDSYLSGRAWVAICEVCATKQTLRNLRLVGTGVSDECQDRCKELMHNSVQNGLNLTLDIVIEHVGFSSEISTAESQAD